MRVLVLSFLLAAVASTSLAQSDGSYCSLPPSKYATVTVRIYVYGQIPNARPSFFLQREVDVTVLDGAQFYDVTEMIEQVDPTLIFLYSSTSVVEARITSIAGREATPGVSKWSLFRLTPSSDDVFLSDPQHRTLLPEDINLTSVKDGELYLLWLTLIPDLVTVPPFAT